MTNTITRDEYEKQYAPNHLMRNLIIICGLLIVPTLIGGIIFWIASNNFMNGMIIGFILGLIISYFSLITTKEEEI